MPMLLSLCSSLNQKLLGLSVASVLSLALPVHADPHRFYITGAAGANNPTTRVNDGDPGTFKEHTDPGVSAELGVGIDLGGFRVEATYAIDASQLAGYTNIDGVDHDYVSGGDARKQSAFLTGYWDILRNKNWTPYLGAGFGYSNLDVRDFSDGGRSYPGFSRSLWGYQFKAGVAVDLSTRSTLFAEAVYRGTSKFTTNDGFHRWNNASWSSWGGQLGVRIGL